MTRMTLDPIFASAWFLLVLTMVVLAVPWLVPVAGRNISVRQRRTLQCLRTASSLLLLVAVFRPSIVRTDSLPTEATIAVLLDRSRSMTLPVDDKRTRSEVQNDVFQQLLPAIGKLDDSLALKAITYAADTQELTANEETLRSLQEPPAGHATDITRALAAAVQSSSGRPLAGVVILGDGVEVLPPGDQGRTSPRDSHAGARLLASLDVPLWAVAIGPPGDLNQVRDVETAELAESFSLFSGNESDVDFVIRTRALAGKSFAVRLLMMPDTKDAQAVEVAMRTVTPSAAEESIPMSVPLVAPAAGRYRLEVRADGQEGETLLSNNSQVAFVDVREGGGRILYIEGQPRPEQHFLLRALRRFPDLQVAYRWIASDTKSRWPIDLRLSEALNQFDIIIIGDLPAAAIGASQLSEIAKRTGEGTSLLMIGGLDTFASGGYDKSPLAEIIPVKLDGRLRDLEGDLVPVVVVSHPITDLNPGGTLQSQSEAWSALPPFAGANRFADIRVAPGIEVLLETAEGDPILVTGEFGSGRVAAFAADNTWRWWRQGKSLEHRRFWRQLMLWLLNRGSDTADAIDVTLDRRRAELGQPVAYTVRYPLRPRASADPPGASADPPGGFAEQLALSVIGADGIEAIVMPEVTSTENEFAKLEGRLSGLAPGMYELRAVYRDDASSAVARSFQILDQEAELRQPFADHTYLSQLAAQTAPAGGSMFLPEDVDELINLIAQLRRRSEAPVLQTFRLGDSPSSAWPLFVVLAGLLGSEWYLRRRWGLA